MTTPDLPPPDPRPGVASSVVPDDYYCEVYGYEWPATYDAAALANAFHLEGPDILCREGSRYYVGAERWRPPR